METEGRTARVLEHAQNVLPWCMGCREYLKARSREGVVSMTAHGGIAFPVHRLLPIFRLHRVDGRSLRCIVVTVTRRGFCSSLLRRVAERLYSRGAPSLIEEVSKAKELQSSLQVT